MNSIRLFKGIEDYLGVNNSVCIPNTPLYSIEGIIDQDVWYNVSDLIISDLSKAMQGA